MKYNGFVIKEQAMGDFLYWSKNDLKLLKKIIELLDSISNEAFNGIGKPEALKGDLRGYWSRRINDEHPLVYTIKMNKLLLFQLKATTATNNGLM